MNNEIKFGLLSAFTFAAWVLAEHFSGLNSTHIEHGEITRSLAAIIPWVFIFLGIRNKKKLLGGQISFQGAMGSGMVIAFISSVLISFFMWVYIQFINPQMQELIVNLERQKLQQMKAPADVIKLQLEGIAKMYDGSFGSHLSLAVFFISVGVIISLLCTLILRTRIKPQSGDVV